MFEGLLRGYMQARAAKVYEVEELQNLDSAIKSGKAIPHSYLCDILDRLGPHHKTASESVGGFIYDCAHPLMSFAWNDAYVRVAAERLRYELPQE